MGEDLRQDDFELLARLAHRYFIDDRTQAEIAREFGLSRPKVQRLLQQARRAGVVEIHIQAPSWLRLELERQLRETFGLTEAIVCSAGAGSQVERDAVAQRAAQYLERRLSEGSVVAVSHGRTTGAVPRFFRPGARLAVTFVSAMGGSPRVDVPTNPNEICRALAERCGGQAVSLYAPAYVESATVRDQLLAQEAIIHTLNQAAEANFALVGVGATDDDCTMVRSGCLTTAEMARLRHQGAVGDILGNYVDLDGNPVASPHQDRLVALSMDNLRRIGTVVAVASEPEKPRAILGTLRAGVIRVLVVDEGNARAILDLVSGPAKNQPPTNGRRAEASVGDKEVVKRGERDGRRHLLPEASGARQQPKREKV
jgi:DNA-binding transcriptional regulator LsrR (DeoR family)